MKKIVAVIMSVILIMSMGACSSHSNSSASAGASNAAAASTEVETTEATAEAQKEIDLSDLAAIGDVEVIDGIATVTFTVPAKLVDSSITQESLDQKTGDTFISAKLNEDGSVTYKFTKDQYYNMLDSLVSQIDDALQQLVDNKETYHITKIEHNADYTEFNVTLNTDTLGLADALTTLVFYMYGGLYGIFSGNKTENVVVNYYDSTGKLLRSGNSADAKN